MGSFGQHFRDWAAHPFSEDMPASHWFLLIGMVIAFIILWNIILAHIIDVIRSASD
jgi:hypothetical protein